MDAFRTEAGKLNGGDPAEAWAKAKAKHPAPGALINAAQQQLVELQSFLENARSCSRCPPASPSSSRRRPISSAGRAPACGPRGRSRARPSRAYYYLTDVERGWSPERQAEHLRDFNFGTLWCISIHEVYPGHFVQYQHLRQVESKVRKSIFFAAATYVEGWAHYCEEMMLEAGFGRKDPLIRLGQLQEALIRLVRFVVSIRLHAEDLSVEQGVRMFREHAFLEEANARREAERGTFDPTYLVYPSAS